MEEQHVHNVVQWSGYLVEGCESSSGTTLPGLTTPRLHTRHVTLHPFVYYCAKIVVQKSSSKWHGCQNPTQTDFEVQFLNSSFAF